MATFIKIADFVEGAMNGELILSSTTNMKIALSNTAPTAESPNVTISGNGFLANVTQIVYTNYSDSLSTDRQLEGITSVETAGVWKFDCDDFTITAVTGALPTWRYLYIWDDAGTTPDDPLIGVWDHGSAIDLALSETANININAGGLITVT